MISRRHRTPIVLLNTKYHELSSNRGEIILVITILVQSKAAEFLAFHGTVLLHCLQSLESWYFQLFKSPGNLKLFPMNRIEKQQLKFFHTDHINTLWIILEQSSEFSVPLAIRQLREIYRQRQEVQKYVYIIQILGIIRGNSPLTLVQRQHLSRFH